MFNMGGGNWGNNLTSDSLMPVSALCAENRINTLIFKLSVELIAALYYLRKLPM